MSIGDVLDSRYRLDTLIGRGAHGMTWRATRLEDGLVVCVKALHFHHIGSLDAERMFRREAAVLRQLDHRGVPDYIDDFTVEATDDVSLYLVQELVDGHTLTEEMADTRYTEAEVVEVVRELLGILAYLQSLSPPVVHRDIKPANVMRRASDGTLVLVDFGSVKEAVRETITGGATVAGTFGYMAPEQFYGRATPASDLYGVGALALTLLSRLAPADMVDERNKLAWRKHVEVSDETAELLAWLLNPDPSERAQRAERVLARISASTGLAVVQPAEAPAVASVESRPSVPSPRPVPSRPTQKDGNATGKGVILSLVAAGALACLGLVGVVATVGDIPSRTVIPPDIAKVDSLKPAPDGLKGLTFGMTLEEATEALPELRDAKPSTSIATSLAALTMGVVELPGQRFTLDTGIIGHPARCELDFVDEEKLARMACHLMDPGDTAANDTLRGRLLEALVARYGSPSQEPDPHDPVYAFALSTREWTWRKDGFELVMRDGRSSIPLGIGSSLGAFAPGIELNNTAPVWDELIARRDKAQRAEEARAQALEAARRKSELQRRMEELKARGGSVGDGL